MTTMTARHIDWRARTRAVDIEEITPAMLAPVQRDADSSRLPQTVWPSIFYGSRFVGIDCLLVWGNALACDGDPFLDARGTRHTGRPADTDPAAVGPLLTILPRTWFTGGTR